MTFEEAVIVAAQAHAGQRDLAGEPYLLHCLRVALKVFAQTRSVDIAVVGVLHDTIEDTKLALSDLAARGLTHDQLRAIDALTKRSEETYTDRITRGIHEGGPFYAVVKLADLEDNMDTRRLKGRRDGIGPKDAQRLNNYLSAWTRLKGV